MTYKLYCVVAKDVLAQMKGVRGKFGSQCGHAYLHSFWDSEARFPAAAAAYRNSQLAFKITLVVPTVQELRVLHAAYAPVCGVSLVVDAGRTIFAEPTVTCLGIGPLADEEKGEDLRALKGLT